MLKEEKEDSVAAELAELAATVPENTEAEAEVDGEELDSSEMSAIIYEIPKEPEKWVQGGWVGPRARNSCRLIAHWGLAP